MEVYWELDCSYWEDWSYPVLSSKDYFPGSEFLELSCQDLWCRALPCLESELPSSGLVPLFRVWAPQSPALVMRFRVLD